MAARLADADGSGRVEDAEMSHHAQTAAMARLDAQDKAVILGLAGFDPDADGWTGLDELAEVVAEVAGRQKATQVAEKDISQRRVGHSFTLG